MVSASLFGGRGNMPNTRIYWLHTLSPTHTGIGRGVGYIDLPIDRDKVTGWPIIRGSAFKGVLADHHKATDDARKESSDNGLLLKAAFGIAGDNNNSNAGALIPTDAKIVCLPVRSFRGTFAWVTSPLVLRALKRTLHLAEFSNLPDVPTNLDESKCFVIGKTLVQDHKVYLEDLDFDSIVNNEDAEKWASLIAEIIFKGDNVTEFKNRFVVLPDSVFDFLCETGTEVQTRVRIDDDTKTVVPGALWTEESLPAETILMGLIQCDRVFGRDREENNEQTLLNKFTGSSLMLQIGGKATVGRGRVRCIFTAPTEVK